MFPPAENQQTFGTSFSENKFSAFFFHVFIYSSEDRGGNFINLIDSDSEA